MTDADSIDAWANDVYCGDAIDTLRSMPESSVHLCMTSPPYFGHRDYGVDGQIGLEDSLEEYIEELVAVGDEIRRVLRDDGSWWLNLGDTFERKNKLFVPHRVAIALQDAGWIARGDSPWVKPNGLPNSSGDRLLEKKEFVFHLVPRRHYYFDLDAIRQPHKQSSIDRAKREYTGAKTQDTDHLPNRYGRDNAHDFDKPLNPNGKNPGDVFEIPVKPLGEAHFATYPPKLCRTPIKSGCPPKVCAVCGTPYQRAGESVPVWQRDRDDIDRPQLRRALERFDNSDLTTEHLEAVRSYGFADAGAGKQQRRSGLNTDGVEDLAQEAKDVLGGYFREFTVSDRKLGDREQACCCPTAGDYTKPGVVLDPFAGAGTTCLVAKELGRRFVGVDLNPEYVALAQRRIGITVDDPGLLLDGDETPLTAFENRGDAD